METFFKLNINKVLFSRYNFNPMELSDAHSFNQNRVRTAAKGRERLIVVDNTNTMSWEMRPYAALAAEFKYKLFIQEPQTAWAFNAKVGYIWQWECLLYFQEVSSIFII